MNAFHKELIVYIYSENDYYVCLRLNMLYNNVNVYGGIKLGNLKIVFR